MDRYTRMLSSLKSASAMETFCRLYGRREGELARQLTRYTELVKRHEDIFHANDKPLYLISAPGRTEILGNHTDHNNGRVMAAAVNLDTLAAVTPRDDMLVHIQSEGFPTLDLDLSDLEIREDEKGTSAALVRGVARRMKDLGYLIGGFDADITSNVLAGSGLSSSAAYEVLICAIMDKLFNGAVIDAPARAKIGQYAENVYFGKPSGLMDQMASSVGGLVFIDFKNLPDDAEIRPLSLDLAKYGYDMVIVNTRGSHDDLTDEYASIRKEMNDVAAFFGEKVLRRVRSDEFMLHIGEIRRQCSDRACLRAAHFFNENERVRQMEKAVRNEDIPAFLSLVNKSGESSRTLLQNIHVPGTSQPISLALMMAQNTLQGEGAVRVHGGGFAGTTLNIVPTGKLDPFVRAMESIFGSGCCHVLSIRPEGAVCVFEEA